MAIYVRKNHDALISGCGFDHTVRIWHFNAQKVSNSTKKCQKVSNSTKKVSNSTNKCQIHSSQINQLMAATMIFAI